MTPVTMDVTRKRTGWVAGLARWLPTPDGASAAERRFYTVVRHGAPVSLLAHVIYIPLFAWWGVWALALVSAISVPGWAMVMAWTRRGRLSASFGVISAEIAAFSVLVWVFVGWGFGAQYALINLLALVHLMVGFLLLRVRVWLSVLIVVLFIGGFYYTEASQPLYDVPTGQLAVVNIATIAVVFASLAALVGYSSAVADRAEDALAVEHARSERLLANVLPVPIAERLKDREDVIADGVDGASVLFADIVGFTSLSAEREPDEVVGMLNGVFTRLDALVDEFGLEKIKTIGDAYMVAAGIPTPREDHARVLARFALAARDEMAQHNLTADMPVELRIGINSGPVVAGVIGRRRFLYDLWGDTVNTASRMESHGIPGCIQITDATRALLDGSFTCTERGVIDVKGKGPTRTWLLEDAAVPAPA